MVWDFYQMVFTARQVEELPSFGEKLKSAREGAGLTKEKVAQLLNLPIKYLAYLESGEVEKLPADVFAKGLLRKYAKLLEVDGEELVAEYEKESRIAKHLRGQEHQALPSLRSRRFVVTPRTLGYSVGAAILFLVIGYFFYQLHFLTSPPSLNILEPKQTDFAVENSSVILFGGQTEPGAKLTINGQQSYIDKDGNFEQAVNLIRGLNIIKVEATNRFGKSSSETRRIMLR
ncbi:MAG: helix-turn-helix domain-containing protein [Candidatus Portnoybacteria bacterium]|nr:helix-turn-helix domain-containing protein [Candidatus Portnoybacteria bacterium]MDD4983198.1 helix-turn-helix domain-containing protein [Candidatus Portnoybacteria bacterium]